ncbi:electron transfer flavoprotein subunit beta/FixA family protein [Dethiosulfatarculus sandiegensis]|uniref:Electron transfer flavoprotein alpha/beta-subunit N-terminal domain-containing protein n=1 Tax=Dethiosulfatarculus sandiegensis TaxID=1429043 RepID=A0A0D2HWI5_9BACT|nr:electron transfer flavoprotein subunit beta/FixA family protein [Dethiosulfatarculus sandiegensis]KIX14738.1 hypothetical protein X474_06245 [Dethiosulfatarculus sandiegensis]
MKLAVLVKQVPMVSELPWDKKTGQLKRGLAVGMMNPACKHALEAALRLREKHGGDITVISMGPPSAEEVLREALALGADRGILLSDPRLGGADTLATSYTLARALETVCPGADLVLLGCHTTDSETGQVAPTLAQEMDLPAVAYVEDMGISGRKITVQRAMDGFLETLEMELPALVSVTTRNFTPRPVPMAGLEEAFESGEIRILNVVDIGADPSRVGRAGSPGRTARVYSSAAQKKGVLLKGGIKKNVIRLFDEYGDLLGGVIGKDLGKVE